jgi:hypothetical protein
MEEIATECSIDTGVNQPHAQLQGHLAAFLNACNFAKGLKTLAGLTLFQHICSYFQKEPHRFETNPHRHSLGLNS